MSKKQTSFFALAVFLLAANLRATIIVLGPLVDEIGAAISASATTMGFIAGSLPMLAFALCSPFAAKLAQRFGLESVILAGLAIIAFGTVVRSVWLSASGLMIGTFTLCCGIALGNVLLAAAIRRDQPRYIERLTAVQMISFSVFAASAAAFAIPLAHWLGWQGALAIWGIFLPPTAWIWWRIKKQYQQQKTQKAENLRENAGKCEENPPKITPFMIWKSPLAWWISLYTGVQSMMFYTMAVWLPSMIHSRGFTMDTAGTLSTILQLMTVPTVVMLAPLVERYPRFDHLMLGSAFLILLGILGVWYLPAGWVWLTLVIFGIGSAASFTLSLMLFALRGKNATQSAALSGMAQTVGYLIAGIGPVLSGWLLQYSHGWKVPILVLAAASVLQMLLGWCAGKNRPL